MTTIIPNNDPNLRVVLCYISDAYGDAVEGLEGVTANVIEQPIIGWRIDGDVRVDPLSFTNVQITDKTTSTLSVLSIRRLATSPIVEME